MTAFRRLVELTWAHDAAIRKSVLAEYGERLDEGRGLAHAWEVTEVMLAAYFPDTATP